MRVHCRVDLSEWHNGDSVTSCRGYVVTKVGNGIELLWQLKNIVGVGHKIRKLLSYVIYNTQDITWRKWILKKNIFIHGTDPAGSLL